MPVDFTHINWVFSKNSSGGTYLKSTEIVSGKRVYYKLSNFGYNGFISHEAVLEVIASRLGVLLGFPVLKYTGNLGTVFVNGKYYTTYVVKSCDYCKNNETAVALVTEYELNKQGNELPIKYARRICGEKFVDMLLIFDYLIANVDRHGRNVELLIKGNSVRPAPIFDNGCCLTYACGNNIQNIRNFDYKSDIMANNFIGGVYLTRNLQNVNHKYCLKPLTNEVFKSVFYGLNGVLSREHIDFLIEVLRYRYTYLVDNGIIICR